MVARTRWKLGGEAKLIVSKDAQVVQVVGMSGLIHRLYIARRQKLSLI